jgi:hypothetical protein
LHFLPCKQFVYMHMQRGASNGKFLNYINKHLLPVFEKVRSKTRRRPLLASILAKLESCTNGEKLYMFMLHW